MNPRPKIRKAVPGDAEVLAGIVREAQRHWGFPKNWIELFSLDLSTTPLINSREIYVAEASAQPVGFYVSAGNKLEELWIAPAHLGTGIGKELFLHAKNRIGQQR